MGSSLELGNNVQYIGYKKPRPPIPTMQLIKPRGRRRGRTGASAAADTAPRGGTGAGAGTGGGRGRSMRRQGQQISAQLLHIRRQPAATSGCIDEKRDTLFAGELGHLDDRNGLEAFWAAGRPARPR